MCGASRHGFAVVVDPVNKRIDGDYIARPSETLRVGDSDGDGYNDGRELGDAHANGGQRHPNDPWDF